MKDSLIRKLKRFIFTLCTVLFFVTPAFADIPVDLTVDIQTKQDGSTVLPREKVSYALKVNNIGGKARIRVKLDAELEFTDKQIAITDFHYLDGWFYNTKDECFYLNTVADTNTTWQLFDYFTVPDVNQMEVSGQKGRLHISVYAEAIQYDAVTPDYNKDDPWADAKDPQVIHVNGGGGGGGASTGFITYKRPQQNAVACSGTWIAVNTSNKEWKYQSSNGSYASGGWIYTYNPYAPGGGQNDWFCFDSQGMLKHGWVQSDGDWFYTHDISDGNLGRMVRGWHEDPDDGYTYYLDLTTGAMYYGWHEIDGNWYYFSRSEDTSGQNWFWDTNLGQWIYKALNRRTYGSMWRNETTPDGYHVDENGVCTDSLKPSASSKNITQKVDQKKTEVYLSDGVVYTTPDTAQAGKTEKKKGGGWIAVDVKKKLWRFLYEDGKYAEKGWIYVYNPYSTKQNKYDWFHFDEKGYLTYGWYKQSDTVWYYTNSNSDGNLGMLVYGWHTDPQDGKKYYLDPSTGIMHYGWTRIGQQDYYFARPEDTGGQSWFFSSAVGAWIYEKAGLGRPFGSLYVNENTPDGYHVDKNGVKDGKAQQTSWIEGAYAYFSGISEKITNRFSIQSTVETAELEIVQGAADSFGKDSSGNTYLWYPGDSITKVYKLKLKGKKAKQLDFCVANFKDASHKASWTDSTGVHTNETVSLGNVLCCRITVKKDGASDTSAVKLYEGLLKNARGSTALGQTSAEGQVLEYRITVYLPADTGNQYAGFKGEGNELSCDFRWDLNGQ